MVKIEENELREMLIEYCEGICYKCRYAGICKALEKYPVAESQELYNELLEIALTPKETEQFKILKAIHNERLEYNMEGDSEKRKRILCGILGLEKAFEIISGIQIDSGPDGVIWEWYTGFPFYPRPISK